MSRFNAFLPDETQAAPKAARLMRLQRPALVAGAVGLIALVCAVAAGAMLASLSHPALALTIDPVWTALLGGALALLLLAPLASDGLTLAGVGVRAGLAFFTIGLAAPAVQIGLA